ncbi:MAG: leucyl aminopeptidase family protein [Sphingosinicella sp.]
MPEIASCLQPDRGQASTALHLTDKAHFDSWLKAQPERVRQALTAQGFKGEGFQLAIIPGGDSFEVALGVAKIDSLSTWCLAKAAEELPKGTYRVAGGGPGPAMLGWLLGQYRFDRYRTKPEAKGARVLLTDEPARIGKTVSEAEATFLVRDLVNIPARELGPAELQQEIERVAKDCGAEVRTTASKELAREFPLVAAVGGAATAERAPRLIELEYGDRRHPKVTLVGKGVCFDSGGLDLKQAAGMRLMKKDMGGAAQALALAQLIMRSNLKVRLHLLIPAVENAVSGAAYRPGDVIRSRKGLTVEIGNTDAEGRLILADALAFAAEREPDLMLDFATLTGAARVALGPDLPALFASDDRLAEELVAAGKEVTDPLWRMPLWDGYDELLNSDIADLGNVSDTPMAGAVTAALFLRKFVPEKTPWAHVDTFAWRTSAKPGRPKGGDALGMRAAWAVLKARYSN